MHIRFLMNMLLRTVCAHFTFNSFPRITALFSLHGCMVAWLHGCHTSSGMVMCTSTVDTSKTDDTEGR